MKHVFAIIFLLLIKSSASAQGYLGLSKDSLLKFTSGTQCEPQANYKTELAYKCNGQRAIFYFNKEGNCDLWAVDVKPQSAQDTVTTLLKDGYQKMGTKYVEAFLASKRYPNHQKFPSTVYAKGKILYSIMPVSLDGKTGEMNSLVVMYVKK